MITIQLTEYDLVALAEACADRARDYRYAASKTPEPYIRVARAQAARFESLAKKIREAVDNQVK